jgi:MATE family multidrug resistance protein
VGAPGYLFFQVARNQCEGLAKTKPGMVMGFIGLLVNIPVNYIFIYGHLACRSWAASAAAWRRHPFTG